MSHAVELFLEGIGRARENREQETLPTPNTPKLLHLAREQASPGNKVQAHVTDADGSKELHINEKITKS